MNRSPLFPAAVAAAAVSAAAVLLRRMLRHGAVEQAVRALPVTPVPQDTVTATASDRPTRTWVVDNSSDWDGNPLELVVPPGDPRRQGHPVQGRDNPGTPAV